MQSAYFFLSDICGYTAYLTSSELDHAQEILNVLFEKILGCIQDPLKVVKLEGDAIFAYLPAEQIGHGQTILDTVESMYAGFRNVLKTMHLHPTCGCRACNLVDDLDLKFFVHHGEYIVQRLMGQEELAGPAVILAHRLLKNTVSEATGITAYALFTEAAIQAMQGQEMAAGFTRHVENYEHLGRVPVYLYDMHPFWERTEQARRQAITPEEATANAVMLMPAPPTVMWDILINPATRSLLAGENVSAHNQQNGRIGIGATYHCSHRDGTSSDELILDWQPLVYMTTHERALEPGITINYLKTTWLEALPDGTSRVTISVGKPQAEDPAQQAQLEAMWPEMTRMMVEHFETHGPRAAAEIVVARKVEKQEDVR